MTSVSKMAHFDSFFICPSESITISPSSDA